MQVSEAVGASEPSGQVTVATLLSTTAIVAIVVVPVLTEIARLLEEIDQDPTGIFWG